MKAKSRKPAGKSARKPAPRSTHSNTSTAPDPAPLPPRPPQGNLLMLGLSVVLFVVWFVYLVYVALNS